MATSTMSSFYYMDSVTANNQYVNFNEGGSELTSTLTNGSYSLQSFCTELARSMTSIGELTYSATLNRTTRKITISAVDSSGSAANFSLLLDSGTNKNASALVLAGFSGSSDRSSASSYEAASSFGSEYRPQFKLQKYIPSDNFKDRIMPAINQSASGKVEVISFGTVSFIEFDIVFATDIDQGTSGAIETNSSGMANLRSFLDAITKKIDFEFMEDRDSADNYQTVLLEKIAGNNKGVGYKLKEQLPLNGYFSTGLLTLRVI